MEKKEVRAKGEYQERGDYHRHLNPNWSYYPTYLAKKKFVLKLFEGVPQNSEILDMGAGEGVFVEELRSLGFEKALGLDLNYSSNLVRQGNLLRSSLSAGSFDIVLLLDVLEHLRFEDQPKALLEAKRVLKNRGRLILSAPNLAHFYSRLKFLFQGELMRTANIKKHLGDRPIKEYLALFKEAGFKVEKRKGLFPTFPFLANLIWKWPGKTLWLYNFLSRTAFWPDFCFLNIFVCRKND